MMQVTELNLSDRGRNQGGTHWRTTAAVAFRSVFMDWRLGDLHENRAGESNIPQVYLKLQVSYSAAFVADTPEGLPRRVVPAKRRC